MSLNFEYYKVFYYVATYKNITRAAEHLCVTQPSVTKAIQNLESQLDCVLFERSTRGVNLTPAGKSLFRKIEPACMELFLAEKDLQQRKSLEQGTLRICTGISSLNAILFDAIQSYRQLYPGITFDIFDNHSRIQLESLERDEFDILLDLTPVDMLLDPENKGVIRLLDNHSVCIKKMGTITDVPVVGPKYFHLAGKPLTMEDLQEYPLIFRRVDLIPQGFYYPYIQRKQQSGQMSYMTADSLPVRIFMIKANLGISFIPRECIQRELVTEELKMLDVSDPLLERQFVLYHKEDVQTSFATRKFLELLDITYNQKRNLH